MTPTPTPERIASLQAAFRRGLADAQKRHLVAYKRAYGTYLVPSSSRPGTLHTVVRIGPAWHQWSCDCTAGSFGRVCVHQAVALAAMRWGVHAAMPDVVAQAEAVAAHADAVRA